MLRDSKWNERTENQTDAFIGSFPSNMLLLGGAELLLRHNSISEAGLVSLTLHTIRFFSNIEIVLF